MQNLHADVIVTRVSDGRAETYAGRALRFPRHNTNAALPTTQRAGLPMRFSHARQRDGETDGHQTDALNAFRY